MNGEKTESRVQALDGGRLFVEAGDPSTLLGRDRVALIASYSASPTITKSLARYATECMGAGFATAIVRVSDSPAASTWPAERPRDVVVFRRANDGYDFGSWAAIMRALPQAMKAGTVLLTNDSLAGPFAPIGGLLEAAATSTADVWGAVRSEQFSSHLQSYMIAFRGGTLTEAPLRHFWGNLPHATTKSEIVERYEMALGAMLWAEGYSTEAFIEGKSIATPGENPAIARWHTLLESGFPFVKRQLLREPHLVHDGVDVPEVVARLFRTDPYDWVANVDQARDT